MADVFPIELSGHYWEVELIARRRHATLPPCVDIRDLVQSGMIGLLKASESFDPQRGVKFSSYAEHKIRGAILDSLRGLDWASRDERRRLKRADTARRKLESELLRKPTADELAERIGQEEARKLNELPRGFLSDASSPALKVAGARETWPDFELLESERRSQLAKALASLGERERKVIVLYYGREMRGTEIARQLGVHESRVSQIHRAALKKLRAALEPKPSATVSRAA